jgi:hypothetical protein|tara:strand:+ start:814 stop:1008 length:195 start_codon:yes stop_codon:yes gene_type:complete
MREIISQIVGLAAGLFSGCGWFCLIIYFLPDTTFTWILAGYGAVFVATAAFWFGIKFCLKYIKR